MTKTRRDFLKLIGCLGISTIPVSYLLSCTYIASSTKKDLGNFLDDDFKLYTGKNPNAPYRQVYTFYSKMFSGRSAVGRRNPGPAWDVSGALIASIDGFITKIQKIGGTNGGYRVFLGDSLAPDYKVSYDHLFSPQVEYYQEVKRGQVIGYCQDYFKLILYSVFNTQDPDNYGENHSYMNFWDGITKNDNNGAFDRRNIQRSIILDSVNAYKGKHKEQFINLSNFSKLEHRKHSKYAQFFWSEIERFRLVEHVFKRNPTEFDLTLPEFEDLRQKFYENQPIVLTLPFKKST